MWTKVVLLIFIFYVIAAVSETIESLNDTPSDEVEDQEILERKVQQHIFDVVATVSDKVESLIENHEDREDREDQEISERKVQQQQQPFRETSSKEFYIDLGRQQELYSRELDPHDVLLVKKYNTFAKNGGGIYDLPAENMRITEHVYKIENFDHTKNKKFDTLVFITKLVDNEREGGSQVDGHPISNDISPPFCCDYISDGARWYEQFEYQLDPSNTLGISSSYINSVIESSIEHIENATPEFQIHSPFTEVSLPDFVDPNIPDGLNTISLGIINLEGVLAVAITHIQGSSTPEIFEVDIIFNEQFDIGDAQVDSNKYDLWSIALHELGHGVGLGHVPTSSSCSGSTMWPSIGIGEISKRDFTVDDETCVRALYDDEEIELPGNGASSSSDPDSLFMLVFVGVMVVLIMF